jgi:hypothetical protein
MNKVLLINRITTVPGAQLPEGQGLRNKCMGGIIVRAIGSALGLMGRSDEARAILVRPEEITGLIGVLQCPISSDNLDEDEPRSRNISYLGRRGACGLGLVGIDNL